MFKILIVDNKIDSLIKMFNKLNDNLLDNIKIVKMFTNCESALNYILNSSTDIMIININKSVINEVKILEKMKQKYIKKRVIAVVENSEFITEIVNKSLPVDRIFMRPFDVNEIADYINKTVYELSEYQYTQKLLVLLNKFNFNKSNTGYKFIIDCLELCIEKEYKYINYINELYLEKEKKYDGITPQNIKWNISKCVRTMNKLTDDLTMKKYFPFYREPPPKIFLNEILRNYYQFNRIK